MVFLIDDGEAGRRDELIQGVAVSRRQCLLIFVDLPFGDGFTNIQIIHRDRSSLSRTECWSG